MPVLKGSKKIRESSELSVLSQPLPKNPTRIIAEFINMQKRAKESDA